MSTLMNRSRSCTRCYLWGRSWYCRRFSGFRFRPCWMRKIWRRIWKVQNITKSNIFYIFFAVFSYISFSYMNSCQNLNLYVLEIRCAKHVSGRVDCFDRWREALVFDDINFFIGIIDITDWAVINIPKNKSVKEIIRRARNRNRNLQIFTR